MATAAAQDGGTGRDGEDAGETVAVLNGEGNADLILVCEHASAFIPPQYENLGLTGPALLSHIAWDPGALAVAERMAGALDAPLVAQRVSRLVYDCNRPPEAASAIPQVSEIHDIPGNRNLTAGERQRRVERYYRPFRDTLCRCIDGRLARGRRPALVTVHSFTPVYHGRRRSTEIGILHDRDARLADAMLARLGSDGGFVCERNSPYGPRDGVTHTLIEHALPRGLPNVMIEIRNDLIADAKGQAELAALMARVVADAAAATAASAEGAVP